MRSGVLLIGMLVSSCISTTTQTRGSSWCFQGNQPVIANPDHVRRDVGLWPVRAERMASGVNALRERSVVELEADEAASWLPSHVPASDRRYYLIRAAIYAPPGAGAYEAVRLADSARFDVHWFAGRHDAVVVTLQSEIPLDARERNIAMILRANFQIEHAFVACYPVH